MAVTAATLADGQLPSSKGTLWTVPASTVAHVHVNMANTSASVAYTVNLYVKRSGGTSRRVIGNNVTIPAGGHARWPDSSSGAKLSAGDLIEGDSSVANVIDYTIEGGTAPA